MRKISLRRFTRTEAATVLASAMAVAFGLAHADTPHMIGSLFGIAPEQTVRLSLTSNDSPLILGDAHKLDTHKLASGDCAMQLKIFGADGSVLVQSDYLKMKPGTSFSHDLKYSDLKFGDSNPKATSFGAAAVDLTNRVQLRVASYYKIDAASAKVESSACAFAHKMLKLSVEVFDDASGKTSFIVPTDSLLPAVQ